MAAPVNTFIQLPSDGANSGKMIRAESRSVGGNTVLEQFIVPVPAMTITGSYSSSISTMAQIIAGTQDGTSTGFLWLENPVASTVNVLITDITVFLSANAAVAAPSSPQITFKRFNFTGTASGTNVNVTPYLTGSTISQAGVKSTVTGMTVVLTPTARILEWPVPAILTAVGTYGGTYNIYSANPQGWVRGINIECIPGEGIVAFQSTAGTASDPRAVVIRYSWLELDLT